MLRRLIGPLAILTAGCFLFTTDSPAKPDYTRRTNKDCTFCHPPDSRQLNEAGRYYQEHKNSLAGYAPKEQGQKESNNSKSAPPPPRKSQ